MEETDHYLEFVCKEAESIGKVFMLDSGEGNDFLDPATGWHIEELSGWLIEKNMKEAFLQARHLGAAYDDFGDDYVFVKWSRVCMQTINRDQHLLYIVNDLL